MIIFCGYGLLRLSDERPAFGVLIRVRVESNQNEGCVRNFKIVSNHSYETIYFKISCTYNYTELVVNTVVISWDRRQTFCFA
jgi:hypothetical protein